MIRDKKIFNQQAFNEVFDIWNNEIASTTSSLSNYGYLRDVLLMKYTQGNNFVELTTDFDQLVQIAFEYKKKKKERGITDIFDFTILERDVFPILAFVFALQVSQKSKEIINKIFIERKDCLTDRLIMATLNPERQIANYGTWKKTAPAHKKYFDTLYRAIDATTQEEQTTLIKQHLKKWNNKNWRQSVSIGSDHDFTPNPCYYGQFAYEVAAVVMAFDIDDSEFKEHIYYPKELVEYFRE